MLTRRIMRVSLVAWTLVSVVGSATAATPMQPAQNAAGRAAAETETGNNPTRAVLVNARRQLALTFRKEQDILEQRQRVRRELASSLTLLADAERANPNIRDEISGLRAQILALEKAPRSSHMDSEKLLELYQGVLSNFDALIAHY